MLQHIADKKNKGFEIKIEYTIYIDPGNTSAAETELKNYLKGMGIYYSIEGFSTELIKIEKGDYN